MDKEQIEKLAREAGLEMNNDTLCSFDGFEAQFTKFAELVAAAERQRCIDTVIRTRDHQVTLGRMIACDDAAQALREME